MPDFWASFPNKRNNVARAALTIRFATSRTASAAFTLAELAEAVAGTQGAKEFSRLSTHSIDWFGGIIAKPLCNLCALRELSVAIRRRCFRRVGIALVLCIAVFPESILALFKRFRHTLLHKNQHAEQPSCSPRFCVVHIEPIAALHAAIGRAVERHRSHSGRSCRTAAETLERRDSHHVTRVRNCGLISRNTRNFNVQSVTNPA